MQSARTTSSNVREIKARTYFSDPHMPRIVKRKETKQRAISRITVSSLGNKPKEISSRGGEYISPETGNLVGDLPIGDIIENVPEAQS